MLETATHEAMLNVIAEGWISFTWVVRLRWQFNGQGDCEKMPSTPHCKNIGVKALQVVEKDGMIFAWTGEDCEPDIPVPELAPPAGFVIHSEITMEVPVEHGLLVENLLVRNTPWLFILLCLGGARRKHLVRKAHDALLGHGHGIYHVC